MKLAPTLFCISILGLATSASAEPLQLSAGTMQLGGTAVFETDLSMPDGADSTMGMILGVAPTAGYFVIDNLEIQGGIGVTLPFGDLNAGEPNVVGFNVGAKYFLSMDLLVVPYAGASVGMTFFLPEEGDTAKNLAVMVPLGVLIPVNQHVAVDGGLSVIYVMSLEEGGGAALAIPVGYLGVQAFF